MRAAPFAGIGAAGALAGVGAYRGVKRIMRARKRSRQRKLVKSVGLSRIPHNRKSIVNYTVDFQNANTKTLYVTNLCKIPFDNSQQIQTARQTKGAFIYGWRHEHNFQNLQGSPMTIRQFWIVPRNYLDSTDLKSADIGNEFFNIDGSPTIDDATFVAPNGYMFFMNKINREKYTVLKEKHWTLGPTRDGTTPKPVTEHPGSVVQKMWIPFNKAFTYNDIGQLDQTEQSPVYYVWFACEHGSAVAAPTLGFREEIKLTTFFKDTQ